MPRPHSGATMVAGGPTFVVRPGETLWSIATVLLRGRATPTRVTALVGELKRLNGAELVCPGDEIVLPDRYR